MCHAARVPGSNLRSLTELPPIERRSPIAGGGAPDGDWLATAPDEVHLWYAFEHDAREPALVAAYDALQTDDERARQARFVRAEDRALHRLTRALQRTVLSRYAPVPPRAWQFVRDAYDKPAVSGPPGVAWPRFNLSHSGGLVACAVTTGGAPIGVDVELASRSIDLEQLADRFFAPREAAALRALPQAERLARFFAYWTLKEAYIKACGQGLSIPLDQFAFQLEHGGITVAFDPRLADDPAAWQFGLYRASDDHHAAVAARIGRARNLVVKATRCTPLRDALAITH